jgi:hypothetical protein
LGDHTHAVIDEDAVLTLARLAGNRLEQARARQGLARARHELSYSRLARDHATQAVQLYANLGLPDAAQTSGFLAGR